MDITKTNTITHLSLCTGYEGIGLGLRRVLPNVRELAYVEIEAFAITNLVNKIEEGKMASAPIYTNLKTFPYRKFRGQVDILSGGFPCQPFSQAGLKKATDDPRHLFPYIAEGIRECKPRIVFLENVEGIISSKTEDGESVLQYVLRTLEELGYRATAGIFSACEICDSDGRRMPHQRKRVFILGVVNSDNDGFGQHSSQEEEAQRRRTEASIMSGSNQLSDSEIERCRRRQSGDDCDQGWIQESSEEEQSSIRSETQRCSRNDGSEELGDSDCFRSESGEDCESNISGKTSGELSDSKFKGLEGSLSESKSGKETEKSSTRCSRRNHSTRCKEDHFVSRPNEPQYEWEEPRVVKAKSKLGGTTDGTTCGVDSNRNRTDRLRLLGNGVIPATAAKAFETLIKRIL